MLEKLIKTLVTKEKYRNWRKILQNYNLTPKERIEIIDLLSKVYTEGFLNAQSVYSEIRKEDAPPKPRV